MGERLDHHRENREYTDDLWSGWAADLKRGNWRSWIRHPISNTRFRYWNNVPHLPRMEIEVASVGSVNHEYRDADCIYLSSVCQRCSFHVDEGTFVPWVPDDGDAA